MPALAAPRNLERQRVVAGLESPVGAVLHDLRLHDLRHSGLLVHKAILSWRQTELRQCASGATSPHPPFRSSWRGRVVQFHWTIEDPLDRRGFNDFI
jgi:hypothetical protein